MKRENPYYGPAREKVEGHIIRQVGRPINERPTIAEPGLGPLYIDVNGQSDEVRIYVDLNLSLIHI
mgnify:CR=1 FL=1